jgi:hypothetical protein
MRNRNVALIVAALVFSLATVEASAQQEGRLRRRLFGGQRPNNNARSSGADSGNDIRPPRQLGQGLQNLSGRLQQAIDSGALDSILGQAGAPIPQLPKNLSVPSLASRSELHAQFAGNEPFTPDWYAAHPRAWQFADSHADAWEGASISAATAWVGISPAATGTEQVHTSETLDPEQADLAQTNDEFLPLGVFALAPAGAQDPSALLQLAVNKQGEVAGNYFDVVTGANSPVHGSLDKHTQLATFKIGAPESAEFEAALVSLTRPDGSIRLRFAGGDVSDWQLARFESHSATPVPALPPPTATPQ